MTPVIVGRVGVAEFEAMPDEPAYRLELSRGMMVREPAPAQQHGRIAARLARRLMEYAEANGAGEVFTDAGFVLSEERATVRVPDVSFVARERIPAEGAGERMWRLAPDLAVEVVSPSNAVSDLQQKLFDYLEAGVRAVWVIEPRTQSAVVWSHDSSVRVLRRDAALDGGVILPGFRYPLAQLFG
jgi:Uma2 family endonuclease